MKKLNLLLIGILMSSPVLFAGGLVTNTNQSAAWARTLTREATLDLDGVFYNPAGLGLLNNGFHFSLSNMSIFQTRTITSDYPFLIPTPNTYEAELTAPIFPSIYAAYKLDKWAFSAGFNLIGGGGSADFQTGLPDFEIAVASLVPALQAQLGLLDQSLIAQGAPDFGYRNITGYNLNAAFNGSSVFYGIQLGATYKINDMISVALGGRYVMANNTYEGTLTDVTIDAPEVYGGTQPAGDYLRVVASNTFLPPDIQAYLNQNAQVLDAATANAYLEATQKGSGFTPIVGVNLHFSDLLNVAVKYEHHTKIELTNETEVDNVGMFPDGEKTRSDLPGMLTVGAQVKPLKKLTTSVGFNYFFDKSAYYGNIDDTGEQIDNESSIDENGWIFNVSAEYKLLDILGVSAGFSTNNNGVNENYQSGLSYALKSNTVAGGVFVDLGEMITLNAGFTYVMYDDYTMDKSYLPLGFPAPVDFTETYAKNTMIFAIGIDIHF